MPMQQTVRTYLFSFPHFLKHFFLKFFFLLFLERYRERETSHLLVHPHKHSQWPGLGQAKVSSPEADLGLPCGCQGPEHLIVSGCPVATCYQEIGVEVEVLRLKSNSRFRPQASPQCLNDYANFLPLFSALYT